MIDLNGDCFLQIIKHLSVPDLISLAKATKKLSSVVEYELKQRFTKKRVYFPLPHRQSDFEEKIDSYMFGNLENFLMLLKDHCHTIHSLEVHTSNRQDLIENASTILEYIDENCSKSIVRLELSTHDITFLPNFTKSFTKLETLSLKQFYEIDLSSQQINFNKIFPAIHTLKLIGVKLENTYNATLHIPHLMHLNIRVYSNQDANQSTNETTTVTLFKENPQIRSLHLTYVTPKLLNIVTDELKNLETLQIWYYSTKHCKSDDDDNYKSHFEHVKVFEIGESGVWPKGITFGDKLEEFKLACSANGVQLKSIEFVSNVKSLKRFIVSGLSVLNNEQMQTLASSELSVTEMYLFCVWDIRKENIEQLIQKNQQLNKLELIIQEADEPIEVTKKRIEEICQPFKHEWNIDINTSTENKVILFEKKIIE